MDPPVRSGVHLALALSTLLPSCLLTSDLSHLDGAATGAGTSTSSGTTTSTSTSSGAGATSSTSSGPGAGGAGAAGTGGDAGTGGAGGGGGRACHDGDGFENVDPWVIAMGPLRGQHGGAFYEVSRPSLVADGDRLVFGMILGEGSGPVTLAGEEVHPGPAGVVLVGAIDDDGTVVGVWDVGSVIDSTGPSSRVDVDMARPGVALVSVASTAASFALLEVDLCTGVVTTLATCTSVIEYSDVASDGEGRVAFSFTSATTPTCQLPAACAVPPGDSVSDAYAWVWDRRDPDAETCAALRLSDPTETEAEASGQGLNSLAFDGEDLIAFGVFSPQAEGPGALFEPPIQLSAPQGSNRYYLARFTAVDGGARLKPVAAYDFGEWPVFGPQEMVVSGLPTLVATVTAAAPAGPFTDRLPSLTPVGDTDILISAVDEDGARTFARWIGSVDFDAVFSLTPSSRELSFTGLLSGASPDLGNCTDPYVFQMNDGGGPIPGSDSGGCAFFARLESDGSVVDARVLDAEENGALDVGLGAMQLPGGARLIVGATTGTISTLAAPVDAPPDGFSTTYFARLPP